MADDITVRLRQPYLRQTEDEYHHEVVGRAADEIIRLRATNNELMEVIKMFWRVIPTEGLERAFALFETDKAYASARAAMARKAAQEEEKTDHGV